MNVLVHEDVLSQHITQQLSHVVRPYTTWPGPCSNYVLSGPLMTIYMHGPTRATYVVKLVIIGLTRQQCTWITYLVLQTNSQMSVHLGY